MTVGIVLLLSGVVLNYVINRRRFYRRGPAGLQHFDNYEKAVGISCLERLGKIFGILLILAGIFFLLSYYICHNDPELRARIEQQTNRSDK